MYQSCWTPCAGVGYQRGAAGFQRRGTRTQAVQPVPIIRRSIINALAALDADHEEAAGRHVIVQQAAADMNNREREAIAKQSFVFGTVPNLGNLRLIGRNACGRIVCNRLHLLAV